MSDGASGQSERGTRPRLSNGARGGAGPGCSCKLAQPPLSPLLLLLLLLLEDNNKGEKGHRLSAEEKIDPVTQSD